MGEAVHAGGVLDELAALFAAISAASEHGYEIDAAATAAAERLMTLDHSSTVAVAAMLAALIATDLRPVDADDDLDRWAGRYAFALHCRVPPA